METAVYKKLLMDSPIFCGKPPTVLLTMTSDIALSRKAMAVGPKYAISSQ